MKITIATNYIEFGTGTKRLTVPKEQITHFRLNKHEIMIFWPGGVVKIDPLQVTSPPFTDINDLFDQLKS